MFTTIGTPGWQPDILPNVEAWWPEFFADESED